MHICSATWEFRVDKHPVTIQGIRILVDVGHTDVVQWGSSQSRTELWVVGRVLVPAHCVEVVLCEKLVFVLLCLPNAGFFLCSDTKYIGVYGWQTGVVLRRCIPHLLLGFVQQFLRILVSCLIEVRLGVMICGSCSPGLVENILVVILLSVLLKPLPARSLRP